MKVQLIKPHTHAGEPCMPDQVIEVNAIDGAWLDKLGIAQHHHDAESAASNHHVVTIHGRKRHRDSEENEQ